MQSGGYSAAHSGSSLTVFQMADIQTTPAATAARKSVDGAGGVSDAHWYVALVSHNAEHTMARTIGQHGFATYVASQRELRVWRDGRRKEIDRVVIPSTVFIHCTESQRRQAVRIPGIHRFLMDRAATAGSRPAIVPDAQLQRLRFMLGATDRPVEFISRPLTPGMRISVVRGSLRGLQGEVIYTHGATSDAAATPDHDASATARLVIRLDILGCATVAISPLDLQPID